MYCKHCGYQLPEDSNFCPNCGKITEEVKKRAEMAEKIAEKYDITITTILIGNNLVNTALSTLAVGFFGGLLVNSNFVDLISTLSITVTLLIFGEITPAMEDELVYMEKSKWRYLNNMLDFQLKTKALTYA